MISALPDAPEGSVTHLSRYTVGDFPSDSAILCRNNAPLAAFATALLARNVACHIVGNDLRVSLEKLLDRFASTNASLRVALQGFKLSEMRRAKTEAKRVAVADRCDALLALANGCPTIDSIKSRLVRIFANGPGITLSTIHRAKGLEWPTVFLLDWHLAAPRVSDPLADRIQSRNLQYVAVTRAKLHLVYINSDDWKI